MADYSIIEKIDGLKEKFQSLQKELSSPDVISDMKRYVQLNREYKELEPVISAGEKYRKLVGEYEMAKDIISNEKDEDLKELARESLAEVEPQLPKMEEEIKLLLIPKDPQDSKNAIVEIRGGTGGDESAIFAGDLFRMYSKYIEKKGWRPQIRVRSTPRAACSAD